METCEVYARTRRLSQRSLQTFDVRQVLESARLALVANELGAPDEIHLDVPKGSPDAARPRFAEGEAGQFGENVDPAWRQANLIRDTLAREVRFLYVPQGGAELSQSAHDANGVVGRRVDPDIEIACGAWSPVQPKCVGANDQKSNVSGDERAQ